MRDLAKKGSAPVYEVTQSHHYRESKTHKSDLGGLTGPIYQQSKHSFSDGYNAPKARRYIYICDSLSSIHQNVRSCKQII